ncbi:hypothetical protein [Oceanicella sp. SM1341]|uniref:hypothetical protein n=1 Tax=Oceanicella sp. SM1341 TaxID=1548889 RepID=UPI000E46E856|nr:hypothetical protein [Oceanicella sp. SM1341]
MRATRFPRPRAGLLAALAAALALQGCAASNTAALRAAYDDPDDVCVAWRRPLIEQQSTEEQDRLKSAAGGAVAAGLLTSAIAAATGDDKWWQKGAYAAAAGALAGYSLAYFRQKEERASSREQLLGSVDSDARAERARLSGTAAAVQALRDCRRREGATLTRNIETRVIDAAQAPGYIDGFARAVADDNRLISTVLDGADERVTAYVDATAAGSDMEAALLENERRDAAARAAKARVQTTSPNVIAASKDVETLRTEDAAAEAELDQQVEAMRILVG